MLHRERIAFDFEDIIKHTVSVRSNLQRSWAYRYNTAHIWATDRKTLSLQVQHSTYLGHGPKDLEPTETTRHIVGPRTARPWAYRHNTAHIWATDRKTLSLQIQHSPYLGHGPQDLVSSDVERRRKAKASLRRQAKCKGNGDNNGECGLCWLAVWVFEFHRVLCFFFILYQQMHNYCHKSIYGSYPESKYRLRISLAHPRDCHFAHVQWLPLSIEKSQTPFHEICVMFMFVPVR